jgi:hypothetical protein
MHKLTSTPARLVIKGANKGGWESTCLKHPAKSMQSALAGTVVLKAMTENGKPSIDTRTNQAGMT